MDLHRTPPGVSDPGMASPTIVFDLDGTLVDTAPDLIDTLNVIFGREGLPPVEYGLARNLIGGGVKTMIVRGLESEGRPADLATTDKLFAEFIDHYAAHIADRSKPFPGAVEALGALSGRGCRLAVCTNKLERLSVLLLRQLKLADRFAAICGQDTFGIQKPDPAMLQRTIDAAGGDPKNAVMVGDSVTDIRTAKAAGIPIVAVEFGYSERPVAEYGPDRVIGHFAQLEAAIHGVGLAF